MLNGGHTFSVVDQPVKLKGTETDLKAHQGKVLLLTLDLKLHIFSRRASLIRRR